MYNVCSAAKLHVVRGLTTTSILSTTTGDEARSCALGRCVPRAGISAWCEGKAPVLWKGLCGRGTTDRIHSTIMWPHRLSAEIGVCSSSPPPPATICSPGRRTQQWPKHSFALPVLLRCLKVSPELLSLYDMYDVDATYYSLLWRCACMQAPCPETKCTYSSTQQWSKIHSSRRLQGTRGLLKYTTAACVLKREAWRASISQTAVLALWKRPHVSKRFVSHTK